MNKLSCTTVAISISTLLSGSVLANEEKAHTPATSADFSGNFRVGFISEEDDDGEHTNNSAFGGELSYISSNWHGLSLGTTLYTTQKLLNEDNGNLFASDGSSYAILGEAYLQANLAHTEVKIGRFGFDSPHADMDDIRMIPNTVSGILLTNSGISNTTLYFAHIDKWAGVGTEQPEKFTEMNGDEGISVLGAVFEGIEHVNLNTWYYHGNNFADLFYVDAVYEVNNFTIGAQFGSQYDNSEDHTGPDGNVYGIMASYTVNDFTLTSAYNKVSGNIINGFGGGPFFSNAADHTIDGVIDQSALAIRLDYTGIDGLTLGLLHVVFKKGSDETDVFVSYDFGKDMTVDVTYHNMYEDGDMVLAMFNVGF